MSWAAAGIASASGCTIIDTVGKEMLDAMAGLWCVAVGYTGESVPA